MFQNNRFTEKAEAALHLAQKAAVELGHSYVGSEHLLLGLFREGSGVAARALMLQNVTEEGIIRYIDELVGIESGSGKKVSGLTPRTKHILELSVAEANRLGSNYIGTEHLLLGLIRERECVASNILANLNVDIEKIFRDIFGIAPGTENNENAGQAQNGAGQVNKNKKVNNGTGILDQFSRDLTEFARQGKIDPVIGRDKEIQRVIQILSRRTKNNPCLIGEPGVGKTAIAEGLAQKVIDRNIPDTLKDKRVITLDLSSMVAGAKYRGEFEDRLKKALEEIKRDGNIILFIDEVHTLIGAGAAEGAIDAANILKPSLARGELQIVGATTIAEYRKYIEKDAALERRFQPILVEEPSEDEALQILFGVRDKYEAHHDVKITDDALAAAVTLSQRYVTDRFLPDKAIDLIDEAASKTHIMSFTPPREIKELEDKISKIEHSKEEAVREQDYEKAANLRDGEQKLKQDLQQLREKWKNGQKIKSSCITAEDIAEVVSSWTGVPVKQMSETEGARLMRLEEILHEQIVGQDEAVKAISKAIRRGRVGLKDPKRPIGSFMFLGPTGVGKTELTKVLSSAIFGKDDAMIRFDMSEYMEKHSISRMVGSPPGYVGYEDAGQLTEKVRRKPYSIVLFDEIEKAHPDVFNLILQVLEDGILTDTQGRKVDFKNTVIILTSNIGARKISENKTLGFSGGSVDSTPNENYEKIKKDVMAELKNTFRPEFINRLDDIIVFKKLEKSDIEKIASNMLSKVKDRIYSQYQITIEFKESVCDLVVNEGYDETYGARPLRRVIQSRIEDFLTDAILLGQIKENDNITLYVGEDGNMAFSHNK